MKNIFNWSILLSICSIFFYWFGFWYLEGYISYFGTSMGMYHPDFSYILISGFMSLLPKTIWLIIVFIIVSFCFQFPKKQWKVIIHKSLTMIVYIIFIIISIIKIIYVGCRLNKLFDRYCLKSSRSLIYKFCSKVARNIFLTMDNHIKKMNSHKVFQILKIKREILESEINVDKRVSFDTQYLLHYMILIIAMSFVMYILEYSKTINEAGYNDARNTHQCSINYIEHQCSSTFSQIKIKNSSDNDNMVWYLTDICNPQKCVVINKNGESKWIDMTNNLMTSN